MNKITIGILSIFAVVLTGLIIGFTGMWALFIIPFLILFILFVFKIFKDPFFGFSSIIFFLPFERVPTYNVGGMDIKINVIVGIITLIAWFLALMFNAKKYKIQPNALSFPLILFVLTMFLSLLDAGNLTRAVMVISFTLFTIALSILAVNMISKKEDLEKIILVLFFSSLLVGLFGLFQFAGDVVGLPRSITLLKAGYDSVTFGFPRIQAFSMEPLYFANYLLAPIFLALTYFLSKTGKSQTSTLKIINNPWLLFLLSALLMVNFVLTVSRGGYIGLIVGLVFVVVILFKKFFTFKNIAIALISLGVVFYVVTFALSRGDYRATNEFVGHVMVKDYKVGESVQSRLSAFNQALIAYEWHPMTGVGMGNYGPYVRNYPPTPPKGGWEIVNNQYLELLAETGIFGTVAYALILLVLFIRSFMVIPKIKDLFIKSTVIALTAALIAVFVQYNSFSTLYIIHIWVYIGLLVGVQNLAFKDIKEQKIIKEV